MFLASTVWYRSRTGDYTLAALVTATVDSINTEGVIKGMVPALSSPEHVHLAVLTPGLPPPATPAVTRKVIDPSRPLGERELSATAATDGDRFLAATAFGGTYQEFDIPMWTGTFDVKPGPAGPRINYSAQPAGTWAPMP